MSRRQHQPSAEQRHQATLLSGYGIPQEQIATMLQLDAKTLRKHYRRELDVGAIQANAAVAQSLFHMATKGQVPSAAIFWLKARAGWKETTVTEQNGTQTIQFAHLVAAKAFGEQLTIEGSVVAPETNGGAASNPNASKQPPNLWEAADE